MKKPGQAMPGEAGATGEGLLTKREVAALLKVSRRCVTNLMRRGWLPFVKLSGQLVRFRRADVDGWIAETARRNANRGLRTDARCQRSEDGRQKSE